jgi:hypothetical protein
MFKLTLGGTTDNQVEILFEPMKTSIAKRWMEQIAQNHPLYETDRFTNWSNSNKKDKYYEVNLLKHINIINQYDPVIVNTTPAVFTQEYFNFLHKHFEDLRGHVDYANKWYNTAPDIVKHSVDRLNILIHEYENYLEEQSQNFCNPTIVGTFSNRPTFELEDRDYQHFTHQWKHGTVYINYCEVGKPLLDVFKDQDEHVGHDAIRPQSTWSADFMIKFGPDVPKDYFQQKQTLFDVWYKTQGYNFKHKSLGMIPVAKLVAPIDINYISNFNRIIKCSV